MKRFLTALLAVLYLTLSSGASVHAHYCMGKLIGAKLSHAAAKGDGEHNCDLCGMQKGSDDGGCCHDEEATFKTSEAQKGALSGLSAPVFTACVFPSSLIMPGQVRVALHNAASRLWVKGPPLRPPALPIYVRVRSFRI